MIFDSLDGMEVHLATGATDMRKSFNGLAAIVQGTFKKNPLQGGLYVFSNRRRNMVKVLYWDRNGFCIWQKRLEKQSFPWPKSEEEALRLSRDELVWLLNGIDFRKAHKKLDYKLVG